MTRAPLALSVLLLVFGSAAGAEDEGASAPADTPAPEPKWEFIVAPYMWFVGINGNIDAAGRSVDVDVDFSDIWDALDVGVLTAVEARRGKFSFENNLIYMKISTSGEHPTGAGIPLAPPGSFGVRVASSMIIWEFRPAWEVLSLPLTSEKHRIALDVGPAGRFYYIANDADVKLRPGVPVGPFQQRFSTHTDFVDWVVSARIRAQLTDNIGLVVSGDYGGFGIGSSSHATWSVAGYGVYRLSETFDLAAGWRTLSIDHGPIDIDLSGPLVGLALHF